MSSKDKGKEKEPKEGKETKEKDPKDPKKKNRFTSKDTKESAEGKKKIEEELDLSSDEEDEEIEPGAIVATRVGYVESKKKKEWNAVYCVLIGGSFYWYKKATDKEPKGSLTLKGVKFHDDIDVGKKKNFGFVLKKGEEEVFVGSVGGAGEREAWKKDIQASVDLEPKAAPDPTVIKVGKRGAGSRMKSNVASKTATSALGKKVMRTIVNEETAALLTALKNIVKTESGSSKKAEELEKNIIKLAVKAYLLVEEKKLKGSQFLVADKPLRTAFELMVKVYNGKNRVKHEKIVEAIERIEVHLKSAEEVVTKLLAPHLSSKNMLRISVVFGTIGDAKFLEKVYSDPELDSDLETLVDAMEYYTQFHFHG